MFSLFRGDLAITLLVHYKDDPVKLARIMDKLLDRDVHQLIRSPIQSSYYTSNPPTKSEVREMQSVYIKLAKLFVYIAYNIFMNV